MVFLWILRMLTNCFCLCQAAKDQEEMVAHPEVNSSMGNQFLFALPDLPDQGKVLVYIYCVINPKTLVSIFTYRLNRNTSVERITVEKNKIKVHTILNPPSGVPVGKRVTYEVASGVELGLFLVIYASASSMASIKMLPESHWGTEYFVYTLSSTPMVLITTNFDNRINVVFRITPSTDKTSQEKELEISIGNGVYKTGSALKFLLKQKESFAITMCYSTENFGSLTGTRIVTKESVGVISGSCNGMTETYRCQTRVTATPVTRDLALDTIPPVDMYGREFILFSIYPRITQGEITMFSSNDNTTVTMQSERSSRLQRTVLAKRGNWKTVRFNRTGALTANKPVMIMFTLWSPCVGDAKSAQELGDVAMTYIVPMELYFFTYLFSLPADFNGTNYIAVICSTVSQELIEITIEGKMFMSFFENITGKPGWLIMYFNISHGIHTVEAPERHVFGVYMYGLGRGTAFISPAGYRTTPINPKKGVCTPTEVKPDDVIDNDCDGRIDEEEDNHEDDDFDGLVDEDTFIKLINGEWGRWSDWQCTNLCNVSSMERIRKCDNPPPTNGGYDCEGASTERKFSTCYELTLCPTDCPPFKWFVDCTKSCQKCVDDCDKFTGSCKSCQAGYFGSETGCHQECDAMAFGPNCNGSCQDKCGGPCISAWTGECPKTDYRTLTIILVVTSVICLGCFCLPVRSGRDDESEDSSSSYSFTTSETEESEVDADEEHPQPHPHPHPHPHHHVHHHHSHHHSHHSHGAAAPRPGARAPKPVLPAPRHLGRPSKAVPFIP